MESIQSLNRRVSKLDRESLDQYFQSIREIELRIEKEKLWANKPKPEVDCKAPNETIRDGIAEIRTMYDLMVIAMQTDLARVLTYRQPLESLLKTLKITYTGHQISHYHGSESPMIACCRGRRQPTARFTTIGSGTSRLPGSRRIRNQDRRTFAQPVVAK